MPYRNLKNGNDIEFQEKADTPGSRIGGWATAGLILGAVFVALLKVG
jgi:hypothetical protein